MYSEISVNILINVTNINIIYQHKKKQKMDFLCFVINISVVSSKVDVMWSILIVTRIKYNKKKLLSIIDYLIIWNNHWAGSRQLDSDSIDVSYCL